MDLPRHDRYDYSALTSRPDYSWPDGKRLEQRVIKALSGKCMIYYLNDNQNGLMALI